MQMLNVSQEYEGKISSNTSSFGCNSKVLQVIYKWVQRLQIAIPVGWRLPGRSSSRVSPRAFTQPRSMPPDCVFISSYNYIYILISRICSLWPLDIQGLLIFVYQVYICLYFYMLLLDYIPLRMDHLSNATPAVIVFNIF